MIYGVHLQLHPYLVFTFMLFLLMLIVDLPGSILYATKLNFFDVFIRFQKLVENQFSRTTKAFQANGGIEFTNLKFKYHLVQCGIQECLSCPYTPNQNSTAEHKHRHITETGLTLFFQSQAPSSLWV